MEIPWFLEPKAPYARAERKQRQLAAMSGLIGAGTNRLQALREGKGLFSPTDETDAMRTGRSRASTDPDLAQAELEARLGQQQEEVTDKSKPIDEKAGSDKGGLLRGLAGVAERGFSALLGANPNRRSRLVQLYRMKGQLERQQDEVKNKTAQANLEKAQRGPAPKQPGLDERAARQALKDALGRDPTDVEVAAELQGEKESAYDRRAGIAARHRKPPTGPMVAEPYIRDRKTGQLRKPRSHHEHLFPDGTIHRPATPEELEQLGAGGGSPSAGQRVVIPSENDPDIPMGEYVP